MKKYTFFFVLKESLNFEDIDEMEKAISGKEGYNILLEQCKDIETIELPDDLKEVHVNNICFAHLIGKVFDNRLDLYTEYYQSWAWDHQQEKFI